MKKTRRLSKLPLRGKVTSSFVIAFGFLLIIILGSVLLSLPFSVREGTQPTSLCDALFTATSAVCVTGLVPFDTATHWSPFGQLVILMLIQIGGMGVMTVALSINRLIRTPIDLKQRSIMMEAISAPKVGGIVELTGFIMKTAFFIEAAGAMLMAPVFCKEFGMVKGLWYSLFHSISAFCNAGFDLMGVREKFSSLTYFSDSPIINCVVMFLIITGGIGFLTWDDLKKNKWHFRKYRMQTKVILVTTAGLIIFPALFFFFGEYSSLGLSLRERIFISLFQSVTTRTAGFNTFDLGRLTEVGRAVMIILMLIGGSPGSTAGGMKTTTFAVMISTALSVFTHRKHTNLFGRRLDDAVIRNALTLLGMYLVAFLSGGFLICLIEGNRIDLLKCLFETASAIGTVGLSLGITPGLSPFSKLILISLMYLGRVGGLTFIFAAAPANKAEMSKLPQESLTVG